MQSPAQDFLSSTGQNWNQTQLGLHHTHPPGNFNSRQKYILHVCPIELSTSSPWCLLTLGMQGHDTFPTRLKQS